MVPSYYLITQPFSEERAHQTRRRVTPSHVSVFLLGYPPESAPDRQSQRRQELLYVYDLDNLRSGVTVRYAIRFDTHPNILKVMRDANLVTLSTSSTRTLFGEKKLAEIERK